MPDIFRVTSSEGGKLQLEAAAPYTDYVDTIFHAAGPTKEFMQLELELFPLDPEEDASFKVGQAVRLVSLAPAIEPEYKPEYKLRKLGAKL